jgi:hypothetical protein
MQVKATTNLSSEIIANYKFHIAGWESSKLSQAAYCREYDLKYNTFLYVRSQKLNNKKKNKSTPPINFVELKPEVTTNYSTRICQSISISYRGMEIKLPEDIEIKNLSIILQTLRIAND